ncbi:hypothetical protein SO802_030200 [Lithocarpus litseifolius]|uniref:RNase H type-1 domain-containing protein n=1 Tax=Lithocarpus litseifolius TaxID=425828 RepID=A0AAW2BKF3_9ROSI
MVMMITPLMGNYKRKWEVNNEVVGKTRRETFVKRKENMKRKGERVNTGETRGNTREEGIKNRKKGSIGKQKDTAWTDQSTWLPRKHPTKVISPIIDSMADARVEILIDEATHRWNHSVIDGVFTPEEAELIKSLPLPQQGVEDRLFWPFTQTGTYTSKSGYRFLKSEEESTDRAARFITFKELLSWLIKHQHHLDLFSVTAWSIWTQRNQVRLNKPSCSPHLISQLAKDRLQEFQAINPHPSSTRSVPPPVQKWKPPDHGLVKINCDGARFAKENRTGFGVVIRNSKGLVFGSLSKLVLQAYSPLEIEGMAAATALDFASDLGFQRAILETDSLVLVKALSDETEFFSTVGLVLDEIRQKVNFFDELHYSHVKREGNMVAHMLARHAIRVSDVVVWMEDVPPPLFPVLLADIAGFS